MKASFLLGLWAGLGVACAAEAGEVVWRADFSAPAMWEKVKKYGAVAISNEVAALSVTGLGTNKSDTAWQVMSKAVPIGIRGKYALCFSFDCTGVDKDNVGTTKGYDSAIVWLDAKDAQIARHPLGYVFANGLRHDYRFVGEVPAGAAKFAIKLGFDAPNFTTAVRISFANLRMEQAAADEAVGVNRPDVQGPRIRIVSETPTRKVTAPVVITICDPSGVDESSVAVKVDGQTPRNLRQKREGETIVISFDPPESAWSEGLHKVSVKAADRNGRVNDAMKCFLIGDCPTTPKVTMRDDGMTLIDGEPFFPIGIYGVCKRDFNAYDFDRAISDLKAAGFNTVHSYGQARHPEFHAAAEKYGMKMWMSAYTPDKDIVEKYRHSPCVIAWYLGDDTSMHATPELIHDRDDNIHAVDPTRLTTQADGLNVAASPDAYWNYVPTTDNFLPEIYPVHSGDKNADRDCVARVVLEMKRIAADQRGNSGGRNHSCWPIIQYFKGWGWQRFPTAEEFYGMNFAAIVHGAHGITWYTYGGFVDPEKKKFNYGVTSSEEVWRNTTNATRRIASLLPVLVERKPIQPPLPKIVSGPDKDVNGNPAVTTLLKVKDGVRYLFAVNACDAAVEAEFSQATPGAKIDVLWENRAKTADSSGKFKDKFAPLAVHVYRW